MTHLHYIRFVLCPINGFAPGTLSLTGKTAKDEDGAKLYELVSLSGESVWVKVEDGKLVKVEKVS